MIAQLNAAGWWWLGTAIGGGLVLLLALWAMRSNASAAARQRLGELGIFAALLLAVLRLGPAWLPITLPAAPVTARTLNRQSIDGKLSPPPVLHQPRMRLQSAPLSLLGLSRSVGSMDS